MTSNFDLGFRQFDGTAAQSLRVLQNMILRKILLINFNMITRNYRLNKTTLIFFCCSVSCVRQYRYEAYSLIERCYTPNKDLVLPFACVYSFFFFLHSFGWQMPIIRRNWLCSFNLAWSNLNMLFSCLIAYFYYENNGTRTAFYVHIGTTFTDIGIRMRMRMRMWTADCAYRNSLPKFDTKYARHTSTLF